MADVLRLANIDQSITIDLLDGTYKLRDRSWNTGSTSPMNSYDPVPYGAHITFESFATRVETMDLIAQDVPPNIRAAQRDIYGALEGARQYNKNPLWTRFSKTAPPESWWLEWNVDGEPAKRSLIYEGSQELLGGQCTGSFLPANASLMRLAIVRHPFWEDVTTSSALSATNVSCWGGTTTISSIPGDVPARFQSFFMGTPSVGIILAEGWIGIREEMTGTANFEPIWECEDGNTANGSSVQTVAGASNGDVIQKASPASTLTKYWSMSVDDVCTANGHTDHNEQEGEYLVLCRCKVDAGTVGLQMRYGLEASSQMLAPAEEQFISHTQWKLVELGRIQIPPAGIDEKFTIFNTAKYVTIEIYAEQISGTSTLDLDALCLIPTHHFWSFTNAKVQATASRYVRATTTPNDKHSAYGLEQVSADVSLAYTLDNWYLPAGNSILVAAGQADSLHSLTPNWSITADYYPRWAIYSETNGT